MVLRNCEYFHEVWQGPGGLTGITLQQQSVKKWVYSLHVSTQLLHDFDERKEEKLGRIKANGGDFNKLRGKLDRCIDPLDSKNNPPQIANTASGAINIETAVNVEYSFQIF